MYNTHTCNIEIEMSRCAVLGLKVFKSCLAGPTHIQDVDLKWGAVKRHDCILNSGTEIPVSPNKFRRPHFCHANRSKVKWDPLPERNE